MHPPNETSTAARAKQIAAIAAAVICLWGAGLFLLLSVLNVGIGFADNEADFRSAFLRMTGMDEYEYLRQYVNLSERTRLYEDSDGLEPNLHAFAAHYDPANTNFRFAVTDLDGRLLLTNDPLYGRDQTLLASDVSVDVIELETQEYTVQKVFPDPVNSYEEILNGRTAQYLKDPADYQLWYFSNNDVDAAYHNGINIENPSGRRHELIFFSSAEEAQHYDYEEKYGEGCTWSPALMFPGLPAETDPAEDEISEPPFAAGSFLNGEAGEYPVIVTYLDDAENELISMRAYYEEKRLGGDITAQDPVLERLLTESLEITIRASHQDTESCYIRTYLPEELPVNDTIRSNFKVFELLGRNSEWIVTAMFVFAALAVLSCVIMCSAAGHNGNGGEVTTTTFHRLPYGMFWVLPPAAVIGSGALLTLLYRIGTPYRTIALFCAGLMLCTAAVIALLLYTTAVRVKTGTFWSSFLFSRMMRWFFGLMKNAPFTIIFVTFYLGCLLALNLFSVTEADWLFPFAALSDIATLIGICYCIFSYFELHAHVKRIEAGDFTPIVENAVDAKKRRAIPLKGDFARFDSALNDITGSVEEMVARQTKAEHLRTELITNVSHDLKTPLTSICNYVDLLSREPGQTPAAEEYLDVLRRQAARLKKLTIDLVDASKASTGSLTVELVPTDLHVMLGQLGGEYEEILASNALTLVTETPDEPVVILADGRQIWRVFDNLLNNACKYAMPQTRVYLRLRTDGANAEVTLKNVSAHPLNISPEELMERFVRGDASRHTEGSGLGLSIARDLTALQNGTLTLETDGDLFKAILVFPLYAAEPALPSEI